jgi:hybrid cluster-associated redox disulfide protein
MLPGQPGQGTHRGARLRRGETDGGCVKNEISVKELRQLFCDFAYLFALAQRQKLFQEIDWGTMNLDSKMTVSELIKAHPSVMDVFIKRKMLCVGCPTDTFHTLADVARIYGIVLKELLKDLRGAIDDHRK